MVAIYGTNLDLYIQVVKGEHPKTSDENIRRQLSNVGLAFNADDPVYASMRPLAQFVSRVGSDCRLLLNVFVN
jgi:hypothetical protein